jgi:hypothetical protein
MESNPSKTLTQIAGNSLDDLRHYLEIIDPAVYQSPLELLSGSTIGQHTRHIIEFYNCLLTQNLTGEIPVINYARRVRDIRIETEPDYALHCVSQICDQIQEVDLGKKCYLNCEEHGQKNLQVASTIERELIYNIEHTIHHLAIVKIALKATTPSIDLPEHFGVAPSTIHHRQESCAQ